MSHSTSHLRAIGFALAGFALWVGADVFMKMASEANLPPQEITAFLGLSGVVILLTRARTKKRIKSLWPRHPRSQIIRALISLGSGLLNAVALKHMPLTMFYIVVFSAPLMIALLAAHFLGEHLKRGKIIAVIAGFIGVMIAIDPFQSGDRGDWIGYAAAFLSTTCFAINVTWLRVMTQSESTSSLAFFTACFELGGGLLLMLVNASPVSGKMLLILFLMGAFCVAGNMANYRALRATTASNVAQFHYMQIILGGLLGYLIWHEVPTSHLLAGAVIIISAGIYIAAHARRAENVATVTPPH